MSLTAQQKSTLLSDIAANTALVSVNGGSAVAINTLDLTNPDAAFAVADWYNLQAFPLWRVWATSVSIDAIQDAIVYANMTPAAAPDTTQLWANRALHCQGKQFNLQNLLLGKTAVNAAKANIRAAFQDCLTGLPSKSDGTNQAAGWAAVQVAMQRTANNVEKLFSTGTGSQASPATMGYEGTINYQDIQ